jgi:hypothetical protein
MRSAVDLAVGEIGVRLAVVGARVAILALSASLRCNMLVARITGGDRYAGSCSWRYGALTGGTTGSLAPLMISTGADVQSIH